MTRKESGKIKILDFCLGVVCTPVDNDTRHYSGQNIVQQIELHHKARALLQLLNTSAAYTHGQIVDAE